MLHAAELTGRISRQNLPKVLSVTRERNPYAVSNIATQLAAWALNGLYLVLLAVCSPFVLWSAIKKGKYREGFAEKLFGRVPQRQSDSPCVWVHAVSVGEVNLLATTLVELRTRRPDVEIVVSTTTKTGYELAQRKYGSQHTVFYCPLDFSWAVKRAMRRVRPDLLMLAELELWPNLIAAAKQQAAKVAIVNGRLSDNSYRGYQRIGWLVRKVLSQVDLIAAQDEATAERFQRLSRRRQALRSEGQLPSPHTQAGGIVVTGSLKYDGAETNRENGKTQHLRQLAGFTSDDIVLLAGSTQAPEEAMALRTFQSLHSQYPHLKLVLVPRHPERFEEVARLLESNSTNNRGISWRRRTAFSQPPAPSPQPPILLVDSVGELGAWWGAASIGFVGGSFGDRGGQNMIEPAAYGVATCFGPNTRNFRDIVAALLAADAARVVTTEDEFREFVADRLQHSEQASALGERARQFVSTQLGATARTIDLLEPLLPAAEPAASAAA